MEIYTIENKVSQLSKWRQVFSILSVSCSLRCSFSSTWIKQIFPSPSDPVWFFFLLSFHIFEIIFCYLNRLRKNSVLYCTLLRVFLFNSYPFSSSFIHRLIFLLCEKWKFSRLLCFLFLFTCYCHKPDFFSSLFHLIIYSFIIFNLYFCLFTQISSFLEI